jgi:predicted transcriptional regulator
MSLTEDLSKTLFPKSRRAILGLLYSHPDEAYYLRQIVVLTGLAVGQVQRELNLLAGAGILTRTKLHHVQSPSYFPISGV